MTSGVPIDPPDYSLQRSVELVWPDGSLKTRDEVLLEMIAFALERNHGSELKAAEELRMKWDTVHKWMSAGPPLRAWKKNRL